MPGTLTLYFSHVYLLRPQPTQACLGANGGSIHVVRRGGPQAGPGCDWLRAVPSHFLSEPFSEETESDLSPRGYLGRAFPTMAPNGDLMGAAEDVADQVRTSRS